MAFETQALPKFDHFNRFPFEIRREIWRLAMDLQIIEFILPQHVKSRIAQYGPQPPPWTHACSPHLSIPPILHVCHESREEALSHYELGFAVSRDSGGASRERCPYLTKIELTNSHRYWNPQCDLVFLRQIPGHLVPSRLQIREDNVSTCGHSFAKLDDIFDDRLRYLAVDYSLWGPANNFSWIYLISGLEKIFVVVNRKSWWTPAGAPDVNWLFEDTGDEKSDARWEKMKLERTILLGERMKSVVPRTFALYAHFDVSDITHPMRSRKMLDLILVESEEEIRRHIVQAL
jgi:hypothetical protein